MDVPFDTLSRADGIPPYRTNQILQDRRGFTWFTTLTELCRWDSYQHVCYPGIPIMRAFPSRNAIPGRLYEARNGTLWVATDVITPFDPSTGKFGPPLNPRPEPSRPTNDGVTGFFEASETPCGSEDPFSSTASLQAPTAKRCTQWARRVAEN